MEIIRKYFPGMSREQMAQIDMLGKLYSEWNAKINVISRRDIDNIYEHHVLHSLAIAKAIHFAPGTSILDLGCGGGFPGVPIAIAFPQCRIKMIDGVGKKILVVKEILKTLGLKNCIARQLRGEDEREQFHFVVSRSVMPLFRLQRMMRKNIMSQQNGTALNGILCLKGGDVTSEIRSLPKAEVTPLSIWFNEPWFKEKYLIYLPL